MKNKSLSAILTVLTFFILNVCTAATYNSFWFVAEFVDANGNLTSCNHICPGQPIYLRNKSTYNNPPCNNNGTPVVGLQGTLTFWVTSNYSTVGSIPVTGTIANTGTHWNYNEIATVYLNISLTGSWSSCGNGYKRLYVSYNDAANEVSYAYCSTQNVNQQSTNLKYDPIPVANAGQNTPICSGQSATLTASGGGSYIWNGGNLVNAGGASQIVTPTVTTTYTVTVTNSNGCSSNSSVTVTVNPVPANTLQNYVLCPGDAWPVLDAGAGHSSYAWYFNNTPLGIGQIMPTVSTGYGTYSVIITSTSGCTATYSSVVSPSPSATANPLFTTNIQTQSNGTAIISVSASGISANKTWELYNSDTSCATIGAPIQSQSYNGPMSGNNHTFAPVPVNQSYVIKHTVSKKPCLIEFQSTVCFYVSNNQRITFVQEDGTVVPDGQLDSKLYPNPSNGNINVEISGNDETQATTIEVVDMQGRIVSTQNYTAGTGPVSIDLTEEAKGIYLVRVINGENVTSEKVIVE